MRRILFVFAVVASVLLLACAAAGDDENSATDSKEDPINVLFGGLKDVMKDLINPLVTGVALPNFMLSNVLGCFDGALEQVDIYEKKIVALRKQCLQEYKQIESIRAWAQNASGKSMQSNELIQRVNFIAERADEGKALIKKIEKHKPVAQTTKKEANEAKKDFQKKEAELTPIVVKDLAYLATIITNTTGSVALASIVGLVKEGAPIAKDMFSSLQKFNKAVSRTEGAFNETTIALKTIRKYLNESQEIEKALLHTELRGAARRALVDQNETMIYDISSAFSLVQNAVFLTLVAAFLIADKPVW